MARIVELSAHEQDVKDELLAELFGSLDLTEVLGKAHGLLSHLVPTDHGALCVSRPEGASAYVEFGFQNSRQPAEGERP